MEFRSAPLAAAASLVRGLVGPRPWPRRARVRRASAVVLSPNDMGDRRFPADDEVDAWLAARHDRSRTSVAELDQADAAAAETSALGRRIVLTGVTAGSGRWGYVSDAPNQPGERFAARMYLAAQSAGIRPLCPHVNQARPLHVMCDPPSVVCTVCLPTEGDELMRQPFLWEGICDCCGSPGRVMFPVSISFGPLLISGNVCKRCTRLTQDAVTGSHGPVG